MTSDSVLPPLFPFDPPMLGHPPVVWWQATPTCPKDVLALPHHMVRGGVDTRCPMKGSKRRFIGVRSTSGQGHSLIPLAKAIRFGQSGYASG